MAELRINIPMLDLAAVRAVIERDLFPLLNQAVDAVAQQTAANWAEAVRRARLWSVEKDAYAGSIQYRMTGPYSAVVWTDYDKASEIENGRPPRDLKRMLNTSHKVRRTKDGARFLVIPFRHNTPGHDAHASSMPQHVYDEASQMPASKIIKQGKRRAGEMTTAAIGQGMMPMSAAVQKRNPYLTSTTTKKHVMVTRNTYSWGGRLAAGSMGPNPKGKTDRFAGMVRFDTTTPGGKQHSTYLTFRVMSERSTGWIVPAKPGLLIVKKVVDEMKPLAAEVFQEAMKRSL